MDSRICLALVCTMSLSGCIRQAQSLDAGGDGGAADAGPLRDPGNLYQECVVADGCEGVGEVCLAIPGRTRNSAACTYRCLRESDCPTGLCLGVMGSVDNPPHCRERCATDADCRASGFGCERTTITTSRGMMETDLCYPQ